jgi:hypothetical protein
MKERDIQVQRDVPDLHRGPMMTSIIGRYVITERCVKCFD